MKTTNISYDLKVATTYNETRQAEEHWQLENDFITKYFKINQVSQILDVPVGTGRFIPFYPSSAKVVGVDVSTHMLEQAKKEVSRLNRENIEMRIGDAANLSFMPDKTVEVIVCCRLLHLVENRDRIRFMQEFSRVLKGELIIQSYLDLPKNNIISRTCSMMTRFWNFILHPKTLTTHTTPWSHIKSYSLTETELHEILNLANLKIVERTRLCKYNGTEVVMFVLRNAQ